MKLHYRLDTAWRDRNRSFRRFPFQKKTRRPSCRSRQQTTSSRSSGSPSTRHPSRRTTTPSWSQCRPNCFHGSWTKKARFLQSLSRIKISKAKWLVSSRFWLLLNWALFFEAAGAVMKIGLSLKPNHHK